MWNIKHIKEICRDKIYLGIHFPWYFRYAERVQVSTIFYNKRILIHNVNFAENGLVPFLHIVGNESETPHAVNRARMESVSEAKARSPPSQKLDSDKFGHEAARQNRWLDWIMHSFKVSLLPLATSLVYDSSILDLQ